LVMFLFLAGAMQIFFTMDEVVEPLEINSYNSYALPAIGAALIWPLLWVCWAFVTRGGLSYSIMGIALVDSTGRRALRWRCGLRALIVWSPIMLLIFSTYWWPSWLDLPQSLAAFRFCCLSCWAIIAALLALFVLRAVTSSKRLLHDRLAGVYLVPQ